MLPVVTAIGLEAFASWKALEAQNQCAAEVTKRIGAQGTVARSTPARAYKKDWGVAVKMQPYDLNSGAATYICRFDKPLNGLKQIGFESYAGDKMEAFIDATESAQYPGTWDRLW